MSEEKEKIAQMIYSYQTRSRTGSRESNRTNEAANRQRQGEGREQS